MSEDAGKRKEKGQSLEDRLRVIKNEKGWVDTGEPDWKERLSRRLNEGEENELD